MKLDLHSLQNHAAKRAGAAVICVAMAVYALTLVKAKGLLSGQIPRRENANYSMLMGPFPQDFKDLAALLRQAPPNSHGVLWCPLNWANYIIIPEGSSSRGVFFGTSILPDATRQRDYPGLFNLGPQRDLINSRMVEGDYRPLCRAVWENNIDRVVVNKYLQDDGLKAKFQPFFTLNGKPFNMYDAQMSTGFAGVFLGTKLASFGHGLDLYEIPAGLRPESLEVHAGDVLSEESIQRDWCTQAGEGRLPGERGFDAESQTYSIRAELKGAKMISILLPERFGFKYRLVSEGPLASLVESVEYKQLNSRLVARVTFKEPVTGEFSGRAENRSVLARHLKTILLVQSALLFLVLAYFIYAKTTV
jgi:hypothetical protein